MGRGSRYTAGAMSEYRRKQREFMNRHWAPPPWEERSSFTPAADYLAFSTLHACRAQLPGGLSGLSMLIVNCGQGVDTHYFQTEGVDAPVIADQAERALTLARANCLGARPVAAATEALPFADGAFDFVGVRAGLHHLEDPYDGIREMVRVARKGVFFIEVHETPLVPILARLGIVEIEEEVGNTVYRFRRRDVEQALADLGMRAVWVQTGWFMQLPFLLRVARRVPGSVPCLALQLWVRVFNLCFGRLGNALIAVAYK